ncbi:MAG: hypothetical protein SFY96_11105 [Planctomycetota bacterium]|nr:hypothetical protein [Planctomycetota bacterium]
MSRASRALLLVSAAAFAATALVSGGCSSNPGPGETISDLRWNPTPEMWTMGRSKVQDSNDDVIAINGNLRQLNTDWKRLWLSDRPSIMTEYPLAR